MTLWWGPPGGKGRAVGWERAGDIARCAFLAGMAKARCRGPGRSRVRDPRYLDRPGDNLSVGGQRPRVRPGRPRRRHDKIDASHAPLHASANEPTCRTTEPHAPRLFA